MRDYYIFKSGRLSRKDNSIIFETSDGVRAIPINDIDSIYLFGEVDMNTRVLNFLLQKGVVVHFFNYYGWYSGSLYPREQLLSGDILVKQVEHYLDSEKRLYLAKQFVKGAMFGFVRNLKNYESKDTVIGDAIKDIEGYLEGVEEVRDINSLMGLEGNARDRYYDTFSIIMDGKIEFDKRIKHPPNNIANALISFINSLVYTVIVKEIYRTQLNPTISYLHEPWYRRFSLALDVAEIFKPIYGDRLMFELVNNNRIKPNDFDKELNYTYLRESGRKTIVSAFEQRMSQTVVHKKLKRKVSYRGIIRLELYKLIKHLLGEKEYSHFKVWW